MHLLLVEDDAMLAQAICDGVRQHDWEVDRVASAGAAKAALAEHGYSAVLLDIGLPGETGLAVIRYLRERYDPIPVIVLTARGQLSERIRGLDAGADDYLVKPFQFDELLARIRAVTRRSEGRVVSVLRHGEVVLDPASRRVTRDGQWVPLSAHEYRLLLALMTRTGRVVARDALEELLYGGRSYVGGNSITVFVHQLRRKLGDGVITTVHGRLHGRERTRVKSLQWRMMVPFAVILVVVWGMTISMMVASLTHGADSFWDRQLESASNQLLGLLPRWVHAGMAGEAAMRAFKSGLLALALNTGQLLLVGLLMWAAVRRSLQPLRSLSAEIALRRPFDATPLPVARVPDEVRPLIASFNALLARVDRAVQGERQFIADAAHELRTPLAALHAYAEVARGARGLEQKDQALERLIEVARRSNRLAEQLLDHAQLDAGLNPAGYGPADIDVLAGHVIGELGVEAAARGVRLQLRGAPCRVECDLDAIGILLRNLIDNAIRHGRSDGTVEVLCGYDCRGDGVHPFVEVSDDGPGVPEPEREAVFRRFHRLAGSESRGSGIGLSLVAGIARLHEAAIETGTGMDGVGFRVRVVFAAGSASGQA